MIMPFPFVVATSYALAVFFHAFRTLLSSSRRLSSNGSQSIVLTSTSPQHLLINAPWLVGSGGTIFLDALVLSQFIYYRRERSEGEVGKGVFVDEEREVERERGGQEVEA